MYDFERVARHAQRSGVTRFDAGETLMFARALEYIMADVQMAEGIPLRARDLFPVSAEVPQEMESYTTRQVARVGKAKLGGSNMIANDPPEVELYGVEGTAPIRSIYTAYSYSVDEVLRQARTGISVEIEKAMAARIACAEVEETVAFSGDTNHGLRGMFQGNSVPAVTKVSATTWDNVAITPADIIADLNALVNATFLATRGRYTADTIACGTRTFMILGTSYQSATFKDDTVMSFFLRTNPYIKNIIHTPWLDDLGAGSKERLLAYKRDPAVVKLITPLDFTQAAPQYQAWRIKVPCRSKTGGLMVRQPKACAYMDGLINAAGFTGGNMIAG